MLLLVENIGVRIAKNSLQITKSYVVIVCFFFFHSSNFKSRKNHETNIFHLENRKKRIENMNRAHAEKKVSILFANENKEI